MSTPSTTQPPRPFYAEWFSRLVRFHHGEGEALGLSWLYFFTLFFSYSIIKPLRDEMGVVGNVNKLPWMFTGTFAALLLTVPVYAWVVARFPRQRVIPLVYRFFVINLLIFYALFRLELFPVAAARAFFIWTSVYNLFVVSVFWSFMADLFAREQGKRLFGFIAAGGTTGQILGLGATALLAKPLGPVTLLLLSALFLEASARCVTRLARWAKSNGGSTQLPSGGTTPVGGGMLDGFLKLARSPYLLGLGAQTLLYASTSTLLYFIQMKIVSEAIKDSAERTSLFATIELGISVLTLLLQTVVTGRLIQRLGLAAALGFVPALTLFGFAGLAMASGLWLVIGFRWLRSSTHYALERPAREVLYTVVDAEEKYKSKSFIDTVVYRGSDAVSSWLAAGVSTLGLGLTGVALAAIPLAGAWFGVSLFLARRQEAHARQHRSPPEAPAGVTVG
ncbi:MAG TPA: MFS transporter [Myxococcaceae bacterium]|nr:MFS transporter [Myxococcaceae bacterium]